jgi:hypothetical protein
MALNNNFFILKNCAENPGRVYPLYNQPDKGRWRLFSLRRHYPVQVIGYYLSLFEILRYAQYDKYSTPEIQTVKRAFETQRYGSLAFFFENSVTKGLI